ncbi:MAG TPA: cupin domain-containing protein, partial [Mycobacteriales bacterium]|nr:cupin domain-containing protein [Mycobacteriales bacterium]
MTAAFPGATGITRLDVYDWEGPDGSCGGSAHMHLLCTEGYVVVAGSGTLQTLGADGYRETPLRPFDIVWFTPGTIHRLINDGDLRIVVVMQNAGLPEAGDFVLSFPPEVLADPDRYAAAASLADGRRVHASDENAARHRKDLAIEGFLRLRTAVEQDGPAALED